MKFQHFIMTRFNLPSNRSIRQHFKDPEWVRNRFKTYENISIPSFLKQTNQNFRVVVLMSEVYTPNDLKGRAENWAPGKIIPIWLGPEDGHNFNEYSMKDTPAKAIRPLLMGDEDYLITSMCDSDDAFHDNHVEKIQQEANPNKAEVLVFSLGGILDITTNIVYMHRDNNHHHLPILVEPMKDFKTILYRRHARMYEVAPIRFIKVDEPYFLRGVDGSNVITVINNEMKERGDCCHLSELKNYSLRKDETK